MRTLRLLAVLPVVAAFTIVGSATHVGPAVPGCVAAAGTNHAALVVEHGSGAVIAECVAFTANQVTGDQLLQLAQQQHSGVPEYATVDYGSYGKAVCQIDDEPTSYPPSCWTASSPYWAMFVSRGGGGWSTSNLGISSQTFGDGDALGFRYEGQSDTSTPPSPAGVCPPPAPPPTPAPAVTATPASRRPTATAAPTAPVTAASSPTPTTQSASSPSATAGAPSATASPLTALVGPNTTRAQPPPPASSVSAGAWVAGGLAAVLILLLVARLVAGRGRARAPVEQP